MTICEDDLPLSELVSPCHHCLDPQDYIDMLPPVKGKTVTRRYQPLESYEALVDRDDKQREKWNAYMRTYRAQHV